MTIQEKVVISQAVRVVTSEDQAWLLIARDAEDYLSAGSMRLSVRDLEEMFVTLFADDFFVTAASRALIKRALLDAEAESDGEEDAS